MAKNLRFSTFLGLVGVLGSCFVGACNDAGNGGDTVGRCGVRIEPRSTAELDAVAQAFIERNGADWDVSEVDVFAGHVIRAWREIDTVDETVEIDQAEAVNLALGGLRDNADLFDLSLDEIASLRLIGAQYNDNAGPLQWTIELGGEAPIPGYEEFAGRRTLRVVSDIAKDGALMGVFNDSDILPAFDICTTPMLPADDPALRREVLGTELYYSDWSGDPQFAGVVQEQNIAGTELVIHVNRAVEDRLIIQLAYRVDVAFDLLTWSFFVNPDTGAVIEIKQNFWL